MTLRNLVAQRLERGKVDLTVYVETVSGESATRINIPVIENYYAQIKEASERMGVDVPADWFQVLLRMPDAYKTEVQTIDEEELEAVVACVGRAIDGLCDFRRQEGEMLYKLFSEKIGNIADLLVQVEPFEKERVEKVKARIEEALTKLDGIDYDRNRLEQELIYYIEKLDVNEEKHRLDNHLRYFIETMNHGNGQGKKLGFICQEIGREINTLGSKSNHAEMQKIVVKMKDELEQIKEQVLNVL
jgi:uncharacterized protein (TIGR00255 family)